MGHGAIWNGAARALVAGALLLGAAGCGGNKGAVCNDTKKAVKDYVSQVKSASADNGAQWKQATEKLAGQFDALAKTADDAKLRKALKEQAAELRAAATTVGTGDASALNKSLADTPQRIGKACA